MNRRKNFRDNVQCPREAYRFRRQLDAAPRAAQKVVGEDYIGLFLHSFSENIPRLQVNSDSIDVDVVFIGKEIVDDGGLLHQIDSIGFPIGAAAFDNHTAPLDVLCAPALS